MKIPMNSFSQVIEMLLRTGSWKATKYLSPTTVVNATRRRYRGKLHEARRMKYGYTDLVVTVGRPNYLQRKFLKDCRKAGEQFPIRKIQLKACPQKRG